MFNLILIRSAQLLVNKDSSGRKKILNLSHLLTRQKCVNYFNILWGALIRGRDTCGMFQSFPVI